MWNPWLQSNGPLPSYYDIGVPPPGQTPMQQYGGRPFPVYTENPPVANRQMTPSSSQLPFGAAQASFNPEQAPTFQFDMNCGGTPSLSLQLPPQCSPSLQSFDRWRGDPSQGIANFAVNAVLSASIMPDPGGPGGSQKFNLLRLSGFCMPVSNSGHLGNAGEPRSLVAPEPSVVLQKQGAPPQRNDQPVGASLFFQPMAPAGVNDQDRQSGLSPAGDAFQTRAAPSYNARLGNLDAQPKPRTYGSAAQPPEQKGAGQPNVHRRCSSCHADLGRSHPHRAHRASVSNRAAQTVQLAETVNVKEKPLKYIRNFVRRLRRDSQLKDAFLAQCYQVLPAYAKQSPHVIHDTLEQMKTNDKVLGEQVVNLFRSLWNNGPVAAILLKELFYKFCVNQFPAVSESKKSESYGKQSQDPSQAVWSCEKDCSRHPSRARKYRKIANKNSPKGKSEPREPRDLIVLSSSISSSSESDDDNESILSEQMSEVSLEHECRPVKRNEKNSRPERHELDNETSAAPLSTASAEAAWRANYDSSANNQSQQEVAASQTESETTIVYYPPADVSTLTDESSDSSSVFKMPQSHAGTTAHSKELHTKEGNEKKRRRTPSQKRTTEGELLNPTGGQAQSRGSCVAEESYPRKKKLRGSSHKRESNAEKDASNPQSTVTVTKAKTSQESTRQQSDGEGSEDADEKTDSLLQRNDNMIKISLGGKWYYIFNEFRAFLEAEGVSHSDIPCPYEKISLNSQTTSVFKKMLMERGLLDSDQLDKNTFVNVVEMQQANTYYKHLLIRRNVKGQTHNLTTEETIAVDEVDEPQDQQTPSQSDDNSFSSTKQKRVSGHDCSKAKTTQGRNKRGGDKPPKQTEASAGKGEDQRPTREELKLDLSNLPSYRNADRLSAEEWDRGVPEQLWNTCMGQDVDLISPLSSESSDSEAQVLESCSRGQRRWRAKKHN